MCINGSVRESGERCGKTFKKRRKWGEPSGDVVPISSSRRTRDQCHRSAAVEHLQCKWLAAKNGS